LFPVMGTALINSHRFATEKPRGCRLAVDPILMKEVPPGVVVTQYDAKLVVIDWIHTTTSTMDQIKEKAGLSVPNRQWLEERLGSYVKEIDWFVDPDWVHDSLRLNGCSGLDAI
jgi:hypothetical protein